MNRYLIPIQTASQADTVQRIPVDDGPVGIYRLDNDTYDVVAEADSRRIYLGVEDAAVSRKHNGEAPVQLSPTRTGIDVENQTSTNPITIRRNPGEELLEQGEIATITDDCVIELGIGVEIRANVRGIDSEIDDEQPEVEENEDDLGGINPEEYVRKVGVLTRTCAKNDDVNDCWKHLQTLYDTITERPVEDTAYEQIDEELEELLSRTESRIKNSMRSAEEFDDEFRAEIEAITERVESIYARN